MLTTSGKTVHSSGVFGKGVGDGAIYEIARILDHFNQDLREPGLTYNVGLVVGGTKASYDQATATATVTGKVNVVPAQAQASISPGRRIGRGAWRCSFIN